MSERYCPRCRAEVADVGGFCLLGHSLRLQPVMDSSLGDLRAEVDRAFEEARVQVASMTAEMPGQSTSPPPPPPPPVPEDPERQARTRMDELWAGFDDQPPSPTDPITQFAPGTRMDWGPGAKPRRRGFRRS